MHNLVMGLKTAWDQVTDGVLLHRKGAVLLASPGTEENLEILAFLCRFSRRLHPTTPLNCHSCELPLGKGGKTKHCTSRRTEGLAVCGAMHPGMPQSAFSPFLMS